MCVTVCEGDRDEEREGEECVSKRTSVCVCIVCACTQVCAYVWGCAAQLVSVFMH